VRQLCLGGFEAMLARGRGRPDGGIIHHGGVSERKIEVVDEPPALYRQEQAAPVEAP
jgi:hypothetical protein